MKHPLATKSLAPYGFVFPLSRIRLSYRPKDRRHWINLEALIARFWEKRNSFGNPTHFPIQTIVHELMPSMATVNRLEGGDFFFEGLPYLSRDIQVLSSIVQWFATNVGNAFLERTPATPNRERFFMYEFQKMPDKVRMLAMWIHDCTSKCNDPLNFQYTFSDNHYYDRCAVTARDRALAEALMWWIGRTAGREFVREWYARRERAGDVMNKRGLDILRKKRLKAMT